MTVIMASVFLSERGPGGYDCHHGVRTAITSCFTVMHRKKKSSKVEEVMIDSVREIRAKEKLCLRRRGGINNVR